ncbi:hypothetical protein DSO57_1016592 [Entomophthora muscae]|uniref:Uncharacterized protein n=1 Tax=Entomophthora muscae TaxID=34485 RepID=A0ACC2TSL8_9FUNG|nr:hypothetical protein DSO57_1016592 [Entomophthora muscae]
MGNFIGRLYIVAVVAVMLHAAPVSQLNTAPEPALVQGLSTPILSTHAMPDHVEWGSNEL